jgi:hypothetical protein
MLVLKVICCICGLKQAVLCAMQKDAVIVIRRFVYKQSCSLSICKVHCTTVRVRGPRQNKKTLQQAATRALLQPSRRMYAFKS